MVQYDNAANYRIDRIMNIRLLDTPAKPKSRVKELEKGLNLQEYMYQNLNMFTSDPVNAEFVIPESAVSLVIDFFGKHVSFYPFGGCKTHKKAYYNIKRKHAGGIAQNRIPVRRRVGREDRKERPGGAVC